MRYLILLFCVVLVGCPSNPPIEETQHLRWSDKHTVITLDKHQFDATLQQNQMALFVGGEKVATAADWCNTGIQLNRLVGHANQEWNVIARIGNDKTMHLSVDGIEVVTRPNWCVEIVEYVNDIND